MDADERRDNGTGNSGESGVDTLAEEQAWDEAMHQAASLARAQGNAPGAVEETIRQAHRSILDWRPLLRRYMTDAARRDYSWSVPNRRFIDSGLYLPSMHSQGIDAIAIIIDTSGSLPGETLARFWAEVREIAADLQPDSIYVLQVDAVLQDAAQYPAGELPDSITIKGRGGTDFRPGFAWLHEQGVRPGCCLYLTDMECDSYPEAAPPYPVAWVNWGRLEGPTASPGASASTSDRPDTAASRLIGTKQAIDALMHEPLISAPHTGLGLHGLGHDRRAAQTRVAQEDDTRPPDVLLRAIGVRDERA